MPASCASLCLNPCCASHQALLFLEGLVGQIPLQPFRCILKGLFDFLRRGDDLDRCGQIASGAVRIAVATGEGKAHGAWAFTARCSIAAQYGVQGLPIKRCAGKGRVDQLVAHFRGAVSEIGSAASCSQWAGSSSGKLAKPRMSARAVGASMPAEAMARASPPTGGVGRGEAAVLEDAAALSRGRGAAEAGGTALLVEAAEPILAVDAGEVGVADRRRVVDQALLEACPGFGRGRAARLRPHDARAARRAARDWRSALRSPRGRLFVARFHPANRRRGCANDVVGVLAGGKLDKAQRAVGA